jgi:hypothetical protein
MLGQIFRTSSLEERLAADPVKPDWASISALSRRAAALGLPFGAILYLISIGLVGAATVGVFFGLGFHFLPQPPDAGGYAGVQPASAAARPLPTDAQRLSALPAITESAVAAPAPPPQITGGVRQQAAMNPWSGASAIDGTAYFVSPDQPGESGKTSASADIAGAAPPAAARATSPHLSAAEIRALLAHGNTALRKGDITTARLLYRRATEAGEGRGALGMGATYDPAFLRHSRLRAAYGDPAEARAWYLHALILGTAGAERRLIKLQAKAR